MDVWRKILDEVHAGRGVAVKLEPGTEINAPKKLGRPRVRGATEFGHYAGYLVHKGGRPRCLLRGCGARLRRDQGPLGCSPAHVSKVIADAVAVLALAEKFGLLSQETPT